MINGQDIGATIRYRDDDVIVFDDKFGVSDDHLDIIPIREVPDITVLRKEDIPMLKQLYEHGLKELKKRNPSRFEGLNMESYVVAGYNHPVSVKHLHLHMVLPPFKHEKVFQYPRWHPHEKVLSDLEKHGEVKDYERFPNKEEGEAEYQKYMKGQSEVLAKVAEKEAAAQGKEKQDSQEKGKEKEEVKYYTIGAIEKAFDSWSADNMAEEQLLWLGEEKDRVTLGFGEEEFTLTFPRKGGAASFALGAKKLMPWVADVNDFLAKENLSLPQLFTKLQELIATSKRQINKRKLAQSNESVDSVEDDSDDDMGLIGTGVEEDNYRNWYEERISSPHLKKVAAEVKAAMDLLGPGKIATKGNALVTITTEIEDILADTVSAALELTPNEPVLITFDFSKFWLLDESTTKLPLPSFTCRQWTTSDKNSFGVKYHLKEIVTRYVEDNWKWSERVSELKLGSFTSDKGQKQAFLEWQKKRGKKPKTQSTTTTTTTTTPTSGVADQKLTEDLVAMGFKRSEATKALTTYQNHFDKALDHLFSLGASAREPEKVEASSLEKVDKELVVQMKGMGFDAEVAEAALMLSHNNMEDAIEFLFANPDFKPTAKKGGKGFLSSIASWIKGDPDEELARQLQKEEENLGLSKSTESTLSSGDINFFVGIIAYLRARLANFTRYCMVCHKKHSCISTKPVICCNPLCIFRYSDLLPSNKKEMIRETMDKVTICPFTDCEEVARMNKDEAISGALYGACTTDSGGTTQEALLEMHSHRYLPNEQVLEFIEDGVKRNNMQIAKVENVLKAELVVEFEAAWEEMKKKRGIELARPQIAYHGTAETNINSILDRGLLVPGQGKGADVKHATDSGWWGKGIYLSPNSQLSVGYCRGGKSLLVCAVIMGKKIQVHQPHGWPTLFSWL